MTRDEILNECPEGFEERLGEFLDATEVAVNNAKKYLEDIESINDLDLIADCLDELNELSKKLY